MTIAHGTDAEVQLACHPLTLDRWSDLEALFGKRGACGGCWCMLWRLPRAEFERGKGQGNRDALRKLVAEGKAPGLLAYAGDTPVAWCAIAPRDAYPALDRSRILKRVDDIPVWSVACLFVARPFRRKGVSVDMLRAAVAYAAEHGATIVEGYPVEAQGPNMPAVFAWTGIASAFLKAGFVEVLRRSSTRPIMRCMVEQSTQVLSSAAVAPAP